MTLIINLTFDATQLVFIPENAIEYNTAKLIIKSLVSLRYMNISLY
jgi:hypothetical protein